MSPDFWGVFHDGCIVKIAGRCSDTVSLLIEIEYLRGMFPGKGTGFYVHLTRCTQLEYKEYDGAWLTDPTEIEKMTPMILYMGSIEPIAIDCLEGDLRLTYESAAIMLDSGEPVSYGDLVDACRAYWDAFAKRGQ